MAGHGRRHVVMRVERGAVERIYETNLVFTHPGRFKQVNCKEAGFGRASARYGGLGENSIGPRSESIYLRTLLAPGSYELLGILNIAVPVNRPGNEAASIKLHAVGAGDNAYLALWDNCGSRYRDPEEIRVDRPETRRQRAKLDALDATLLDEGNRILEVLIRLLLPL